MLEQSICHEMADLAGPDDERRFRIVSPSTIWSRNRSRARRPSSEEQGRERPQAYRLRGDVVGPPIRTRSEKYRRDREQGHGHDPRRSSRICSRTRQS